MRALSFRVAGFQRALPLDRSGLAHLRRRFRNQWSGALLARAPTRRLLLALRGPRFRARVRLFRRVPLGGPIRAVRSLPARSGIRCGAYSPWAVSLLAPVLSAHTPAASIRARA